MLIELLSGIAHWLYGLKRSDCCPIQGWKLEVASSINDRGEIVGWG
jgi:hypothetical protein